MIWFFETLFASEMIVSRIFGGWVFPPWKVLCDSFFDVIIRKKYLRGGLTPLIFFWDRYFYEVIRWWKIVLRRGRASAFSFFVLKNKALNIHHSPVRRAMSRRKIYFDGNLFFLYIYCRKYTRWGISLRLLLWWIDIIRWK